MTEIAIGTNGLIAGAQWVHTSRVGKEPLIAQNPADSVRVSPRVWGQIQYPPGAKFGPRTLIDFEFVWIMSGDVRWEVAGEIFQVSSGGILLARPGMKDAFAWDSFRRTHLGYVHFAVDDPAQVLPGFSSWPMVVSPGEPNALRPGLDHVLISLGRRDSVPQALIEHSLRQVLLMFVFRTFGLPEAGLPGEHAAVAATLRALKELWSGQRLVPVSVESLAKRVGVSESHLIRTLKAELGLTPHQLTSLIRLDRAASLLCRTNLTVSEIADQCGFESPFHFSRRFRALQGIGPREYRNQVLSGASLGSRGPSAVQRFSHWLFI